MQEIFIHNWDELQQAVFDDVWDEKIMRYRDNRIYRGTADLQWNLVPSLNRVCGHNLALESQVFRRFRKYGYAELAEYSGFWKLLPVTHSIMDCPHAFWTGRIRRWLQHILRQKIPAAMTGTASFGAWM